MVVATGPVLTSAPRKVEKWGASEYGSRGVTRGLPAPRVSTRDQNPQLKLDPLEVSGYDQLVSEMEAGKRGWRGRSAGVQCP